MKKNLLVSIMLVCALGLTFPVFAEEAAQEPPALSEEDRPALPPHVKETDVVAVFAKPQAQPAPVSENAPPAPEKPAPEGAEEQPAPPAEGTEVPPVPEEAQPKMLDTIWIYYADNTFDQYADVDGKYVMFSKGTYTLDGSFEEGGSIVINRAEKMSAETNTLEAYESSHEYELGTLGFELLGGDGILAIFGDASREEITDDEGITRYLDTFWVFMEDGTFKQYVFRDENVSLHSSGKYEFNDIGDFHMPFDDKEHGTITLKWDFSEDPSEQGEKICDLNSLGMDCLFERFEEEILPPEE